MPDAFSAEPVRDLRISVVIPTYNRRDLLRECLRSIQAQTLPAAEIVVVDDGSTDGTHEMIAAEFGAVRCVRAANAGVVQARITGIAHARHDWIALCDSDDLWTPEHLARRAALLRRHPECPYSFGNFRIFDGRQPSVRTKFDDAPPGYWDGFGPPEPGEDAIVARTPLYASILRFQPVFPSTVVLHRAFYERIGGFDARLSRAMSEDLEFTLRCVEHAPALVDRVPTVLIRKHASNASGDVGRMLVGDVAILEMARAQHRSAAQHRAILDDEISLRSRQAAEIYFACGDLQRFEQLAAKVGPAHRSLKWRCKRAIARLPRPLAAALQRRLVGADGPAQAGALPER